MKINKFVLITVCFSLVLISLSLFYYLVVFLPQKELATEARIKRIEKQTLDIQSRVQNIPVYEPQGNTKIEQKIEDVKNSIIQNQQEEQQNESNCESSGGRYQGGGTCVFY